MKLSLGISDSFRYAAPSSLLDGTSGGLAATPNFLAIMHFTNPTA